MDIKFAHVLMALDKLKGELGYGSEKDTNITFNLTEDNPGEGQIISCLSMRVSGTKLASDYDDYKTSTQVEATIELFSDSDNRPPRLTVVHVRDLEKKEKS